MKTYFVLHGTESSPYSNWLQSCYEKIENEEERVKCFVPHLPTFHKQSFENWAKIMDGYYSIGLIKENSVFICHSSSCVFAVRYLIERKIKIEKLICVAGFNNYLVGAKDYDEVNEKLFIKNASSIKNFATKRICIYSDNDPYLKLEVVDKFAEEIFAEKVIIKNGGHLNKASGYTKADFLVKYI